MLVYGDHDEVADPRSVSREINRQLKAIERMPPGLARHAKLVGALVEAGKLLQGIADRAFAQSGRDVDATDALSRSLLELGRAVCRSWDSGFQDCGALPRLNQHCDWPGEVDLRLPEGFAFYGVYPEAYIEAARRLRLLAPPRVIGIRSIGTSLAAVVAAALGAPPPVTVRPFGDPFARKIVIPPALEHDLLQGDAHFIIVDEGPGQSGSSFCAVADWLLERGVPHERIALLPSHGGEPGASASDEHRRLWRRLQREVADFRDRWREFVARSSATLLGPLDDAPRGISGGAWRQLRYANENEWPAVVPAWERRKFLVRAAGESFVVKFVGLGGIGEEKLATARALHSEGLVPEPVGLVHGFLIERWCEEASPLRRDDKPVTEIGHYIGTRAKLLPAMRGSGASIAELLEMARRNISLEFGDAAASSLDRFERRCPDLQRRVVRVRTDNKLDPHEWLRTSSNRLIKADAIDHHQAHDLIGCQDLAWDAAGAMVEFDLDQDEARGLVSRIEDNGARVDPDLLKFYRVAYLTFRLGQARLGESMTFAPAEKRRIRRSGERYAAELQHLLESTGGATRPESLVG